MNYPENFKTLVLKTYSEYVLITITISLFLDVIKDLVTFDVGEKVIRLIISSDKDVYRNLNLIDDFLKEVGIKSINKQEASEVVAYFAAEEILNNPKSSIAMAESLFHTYFSIEGDGPLFQLAYSAIGWEDGVSKGDLNSTKEHKKIEILQLCKEILKKLDLNKYFI